MGKIFLVMLAVYALTVFLPKKQQEEHQEEHDMEAVKMHIDKANEYRLQLQKIDDMITDFELIQGDDREIMKNLKFSYQSRGGQNTEVEILFSDDETTEKLLELLNTERSRLVKLLLDETKKI